MSDSLFEDLLPGGATWSHVLKRGTALRITDRDGGTNVGALFYNSERPVERYNMPDTLKAQHIARVTTGNVLYSDMGRVLCSVVADTCGWHDTITGLENQALSTKKYGPGDYQALRNDWHRNSRDNLLVELAKYGLGKRDFGPNLNFFVKVTVDAEGKLAWIPANSKPGSFIELRSEMNTLVLLSNTPHPLDPATQYSVKPVHIGVRVAEPVRADDPCRTSCPENERGFALTDAYFR
jgi:urea carboxylase-associated protein 2